MGMYTGLRFKGIVKEEFRDKFENIALYGEWEDSDDYKFFCFGVWERASFIPCGVLCYMPDEWENSTDFNREWDSSTGRWVFQCSLKNYNDEIEGFLNLVPYFIEEVEYAEVYYEEWRYSKRYELIDRKMVMTNDKFIDYDISDEWEGD